MSTRPRYDGSADWYEQRFASYAQGDTSSAAHLLRLLGPGEGWALDIGCGTGLHFDAIAATGRRVLGVDISGDQLRLASERSGALVRADGSQLPFADGCFGTASATYLHTDVDDIAPIFAEVGRVLRPGGRFIYIGTHPCFVGHFIELRDERTKIVHTGYREAGWQEDSPYFGEHGCGRRVGYRHVPLADLIGALIDAGLRLTRIEEPEEELPPGADIPGMIALVAVKEG
jgi:SAM-dependent methyltransferase